jgi:hypothetical protein
MCNTTPSDGFGNAFSAGNKKGSSCANASTELNDIVGSNKIQHVRIRRVQGQNLTDLNQVAEDTNHLFDELFMIAADQDLGFDQNKWIQKGFFACCERTIVPSCESECLVRKTGNRLTASMSHGSSLPPPMRWLRARHFGASSVLDGNKI